MVGLRSYFNSLLFRVRRKQITKSKALQIWHNKLAALKRKKYSMICDERFGQSRMKKLRKVRLRRR